MSNEISFGRLITAMVTPFKADGSVNYEMAIELGHYLIENGTDTILLSGTTGESPTLTHEEEFTLYKEMIAVFKGKVKLMAGTGSNCTRTAVTSSQKAQELGIDAVLQVSPYYNKPSQEGLYQHFKMVADNTDIPILLYNIPGRTSVNIAPETMARLAEIPAIIGVKEAAGSVDQLIEIRKACPEDFILYSGDDGLTLDFMKEGACGVVSVASHIAGKEIQEMMAAYVSKNLEAATVLNTKLSPLFEALFLTSNPVPVKAALGLIGFSVGDPRLPLVPLTSAEKTQLEIVLDRYLEST